MSNDTNTAPYSEMIDAIEALSDEDLAKELSFAEGFDVGPNDAEHVPVWREVLRHEFRCRGVFVAGDSGYATVEEWMADSDYTLTDEGWVDDEGCGPIDPHAAYAHAHQAMTWADAIERVLA